MPEGEPTASRDIETERSGQLRLRALYWTALLLAGVGLFLLVVIARRSEVPTADIQDINETMNWAYVRIEGRVTRYPSYDQESGYLSFWVDDGSGEILVAAYRNESQALVSDGRVPAIGDQVSVQGTLRVKQNYPSLTLNVAEHLVIESPLPLLVPVGDVDQHIHHKICVEGQVREVRTPYEGLTVLSVRDQTGQVDVVYGADLVHLDRAPVDVRVGDAVQVCGAVTSYKDRPQIALDRAASLQPLSNPIAMAGRQTIADAGLSLRLPALHAERWVRIQGAITELRRFSTGLKCVMNDGTGEIALVLWDELLTTIGDRVDLHEGTWLDVQGPVSEYRGELELIPELESDVQAIQAAGSATIAAVSAVSPERTVPPPVPDGADQMAAAGELTPSHVDKRTTVVTPSSAVAVATPQTLAGTATLEQDDIRPPKPNAVFVPLPSPTPLPDEGRPAQGDKAPPMAATGQLVLANVGQRVTVHGQIEEAIQFATGVKSYVNDGSGPVAVWMPQAIYGALPNGAGWRVNSTVQVSGNVQEYKGEIEVVPQMPGDVSIQLTAATGVAELVPIGHLDASRAGEWVSIEGEVVSVEPFSKGIKFQIDDGSGRITLLLWQNVYEAVPKGQDLAVGATIRAAGTVNEYRGELELVPGLGVDVSLVPEIEAR